MKESFDKPEGKLITLCNNCGRRILRYDDGTIDKYYKCRYEGATLNLCDSCVEDVAYDYYKAWSGGFA